MADSEDKADAIIEKIDKRLKSVSIFSSKTSRLEEAEEEYQKAANLFKVAKKWDKAGDTFRKLANVSVQLGNKHQGATSLIDASNCFRKSNIEDSVKCLQEASEIFTDIGKFSPAAKAQKEIGEILEENNDYEGAVKAFDTAADYYSGENSQSLANGCRIKSGGLYALLEKYEKAIEIFEQVGMTSVDSPLTKFNAKDHFFRAAICHLCTGDLVSTERSIQKYCDWDTSFQTQREHKLLAAILHAYKEFDVDEFTGAVGDYDSISKLDNWKTTMLLRIKTAIKSGQVDVL